VVARLTGRAAPAPAQPQEAPRHTERMGELMEHFRAMMEDDF